MNITELILQVKAWEKSNQEVTLILKPLRSYASLLTIERDINQIPFSMASLMCLQSLDIVSGFYFEKFEWTTTGQWSASGSQSDLCVIDKGGHCSSCSYWKANRPRLIIKNVCHVFFAIVVTAIYGRLLSQTWRTNGAISPTKITFLGKKWTFAI